LSDEIDIQIKKDPSIKITSNQKSLETDQNLVIKAAKLIKKKFKIPFGFYFSLKKNIPIGSGLGGGSSNAASTLIGLNTVLDLDLPQEELYELGAKLGSDVNFFLSQSNFALLRGRGEKVKPLEINKKFKHFIIWPGVSVSTKNVYKNTRVKLTKFFNNANILQYALSRGDIFLIKKSIFNALEKGSFLVCSELKKAKEYLRKKSIFSMVTGSGSALYTIGDDSSISKLKNFLPAGWAVFDVKTF
tara:strand:- start:456 stop:1190 length:735 start_codon:yes stop_codon:yes gene_type:complete